MTDSSAPLSSYFAIQPQTAEDRILRLLIELGYQVVDADEGALLLQDSKAKELVFAMVVGRKMGGDALRGKRVPIGKGLTGLAAATREVQVGAPAGRDVGKSTSGIVESPMAVIAAPMLSGDRVVGVLTAVSFRAGKTFSANDAKIYGRFATVAALIMDLRRQLSDAGDIERAQGGQSVFTRQLSDRETLEQKMVNLVGKIVRTRPEALEQVVRILESIDVLTGEP